MFSHIAHVETVKKPFTFFFITLRLTTDKYEVFYKLSVNFIFLFKIKLSKFEKKYFRGFQPSLTPRLFLIAEFFNLGVNVL